MRTLRPQLRTFQEAGILSLADVHTAVRVCRLADEPNEHVRLALALAVRALRHGSVCLELDHFERITADEVDEPDAEPVEVTWPDPADVLSALQVSVLVTGGPAGALRPLTLVESDEGWLLYLDRYFCEEQLIRHALVERERSRPTVDVEAARTVLAQLFVDADAVPTLSPDRQRIAAAVAATEWITILAGGPGRGKTHTVARILALLFELHGPDLRVALAAPTGKAAGALTEAVVTQGPGLGLPEGLAAMTLHRLLGWKPGSSIRFRHDAQNRLPYDLVVIDETSMVSLTMMSRLMEALPRECRLILVGDPDQLASVDAGAVLADLVARPTEPSENTQLAELVQADLAADVGDGEPSIDDVERQRLWCGVVRLQRSRRFTSAISELADAVRLGHADEVLAMLDSGDGSVSLHHPGEVRAVRDDVTATGVELISAAQAGDAVGALTALRRHRLLCAHREGPAGQRHWSARAVEWTADAVGHRLDPAQFYPGQPLLVTANDYDTGVFNGDIGVVVSGPGSGVIAAIDRAGQPLLVHPTTLASVQTAYAMTIHRSQGSQYPAVTVILPEHNSPLLSRQLLYTAITRAQDRVRIIATEDAIRRAVEQEVVRASGLRRTVMPNLDPAALT